MLHTLYSLSRMQENSNIVLDQSHYTIFDSRTFKANVSIEDAFDNIYDDFVSIWNDCIYKFISSIINSNNIFTAKSFDVISLIPEEGIYLNIQGLDSKDISHFVKYQYHGHTIRLIGITTDKTDKNNSLSIFDSPVYDPIHKEYYSAISIFLYTNIFRTNKDNTDIINNILLRITNYIALNFMDNVLSNRYNVPLNRTLSSNTIDANKDAIILPESLNISDTRFMFSYFFTLFKINNTILNSNIVNIFTDYSSIISLPDIFKFDMTDEEAVEAQSKMSTMDEKEAEMYALGFKHKIYSRIWSLSSKLLQAKCISDKDYIEICSDIMTYIEVNIDKTFYESIDEMPDYEEQEETQEGE